jgi:hypothetical protein
MFGHDPESTIQDLDILEQELTDYNKPDAFIRAVHDDKIDMLPLSFALCRHDLEITQDSDIIGHFKSISDCKYAMSEEYNICPSLGKNINIS